MSLETRSNSALYKRAEQLRRWEESDTNREPVSPKQKSRKIKFSSGCVFLAACAAGDKDEVLNLLEKGADIDTANVDGLTALHQACIDDNLDMVEFLVEHGADVNRGDNEGWTPLHATASCGFLSIAKYLIEAGADVATVNNDGELPLDIAECHKMEDLLRHELDKRGIDCDAARSEEERIMLRDAKEWLATKSSLVDASHPKNGATALHVASAKGYSDVIKILLQCGSDIDAQDVDGWTPLHAAAHWGQKEACQLLAENLADMDAKNYVGQTPFDLSDSDMFRYLEDLKKKQNKEDVISRRQAKKRIEKEDRPLDAETPSKVKKVEVEVTAHNDADKIISDDIEKKNRMNALNNDTSTTTTAGATSPTKKEKEAEDEAMPSPKKTIESRDSAAAPATDGDGAPLWRSKQQQDGGNKADDTVSRNKNTSSFNYRNSITDLHNDNEVILRRGSSQNDDSNSVSNSVPTPTETTNKPPISSSQPLRRSFVPPVRDEESETQRKAHAKRVRETRRSTQGVTLEEIKSAEQFVKKTNQNSDASGDSSNNGITVTATITTATPTIVTREAADEGSAHTATHERRPSWRLRVDNGCKFKLEDATKPAEAPSTPSFIRRSAASTTGGGGGGGGGSSAPRPSSAPIETADATITLPLRRPKSMEEKDQDKENDVRNAQGGTLATQAAIQRRRRPKRRSTGVVSFDNIDDLDQEKDSSGGGGDFEESKVNHQESGVDRSSRSRISSNSDIRNENGEIDYKKLYEQQLAENDRLKDKLRKSEDELRDTKQTLERLNVVTSKNSLSELEKRERRAMERKLSEMEEELKQLQKLKSENERLKADNRSLTRVINKLTNSAKK